jgi:hypothetical protein
MAFKKGQSGNIAGRPAGKTPGAQIRKAIETRSDDILQAVIDAAVSGDMVACKMLLDRITPPLKPVTANVAIALPNDTSLSEQGSAIMKSTLSGDVPPDIGSQLIIALAHQAKIVEIDDLLKRIEALEQKS